MTAVISIVAPVVDVEQIERAVHAAHIALRDSDARVSKSESRAAVDREDNARCRIALGRSLVEARKAWPARGPKAKGWGEFLARQGIEQSVAYRMMQLAGYVEVSCPDEGGHEIPAGDIPSRREVAAARKPAPDPDAPPDDWAREVAARREQTAMPDPPQRPTLTIARAPAELVRPSASRIALAITELDKALESLEGRNAFEISVVGVSASIKRAIAALKEASS